MTLGRLKSAGKPGAAQGWLHAQFHLVVTFIFVLLITDVGYHHRLIESDPRDKIA
jgi:hypothetical protein